jgi:hypothetical protein
MAFSRSFAVAAVIAFVVVLGSASAASASPPIPAPINGPATYPAGEVCSFPVRVEPVLNKDVLHVLSNGTWIVTGQLVQKATNLMTSESVEFHSGPLQVRFHADGSLTFISLGPILWTIFPEDPGGPGLQLYRGRVVIEVNAGGATTSVSRIPSVVDVCELLAN